MSVTVRRLAEDDKGPWDRLFRGYIDFYLANVPDDVIEITWRRLMAGGEGAHLGLVAVDAGDHPVGFAHVLLHRSTWSVTCYCYLEDLYVDPALRGQGIGRALIEATYGLADAAGATRTYWVTQENNATARTLYDRLGNRVPFVVYRR